MGACTSFHSAPYNEDTVNIVIASTFGFMSKKPEVMVIVILSLGNRGSAVVQAQGSPYSREPTAPSAK